MYIYIYIYIYIYRRSRRPPKRRASRPRSPQSNNVEIQGFDSVDSRFKGGISQVHGGACRRNWGSEMLRLPILSLRIDRMTWYP